MEIQLGQPLQTHTSIEGFDPHNYNHGLINQGGCYENKKYVENNRSFEESFGYCSKSLPLLIWNGQPNEEDDRGKKMNQNVHISNK